MYDQKYQEYQKKKAYWSDIHHDKTAFTTHVLGFGDMDYDS